jgi:hypothetical protein
MKRTDERLGPKWGTGQDGAGSGVSNIANTLTPLQGKQMAQTCAIADLDS